MGKEIATTILLTLSVFGFIVFIYTVIGLCIDYYGNSSIDGHRNPPLPPNKEK